MPGLVNSDLLGQTESDGHQSQDESNVDTDIHAKKRWREDDDMILLIQVNNDRPFLAERHTTKAWSQLASTISSADNFSRRYVTGKLAAHRFKLLLKQHAQFQQSSKYQSGTSQEESGKIQLLDELTELVNDNETNKSRKRAADESKKEERLEGARLIRHEAMSRAAPRKSQEITDSDAPSSGKKRMILEAQEMEVAPEREKLEFKKAKFEREMEDREKEREERRLVREMESKRNDAMMAIIQQLLAKSLKCILFINVNSLRARAA
ncbi:Aste57867_17933 [Aphanomyces stellatus]|uniref:Aste57867_17933 protein n=1 Tax=Aphanomyces stellatus TaxID=120398 RepID=A0A485LA12_9STRA|nr:hypothetical protein As57867_017871 [Aphanomyces stellatus]VFT94674.1 Aste57867_17933 [Aphanomyces stellatus]